MWIVLFALRYKYSIAVLAILILLFGVMSARRMSTDILPRVDSPEITVVWTYAGLNAAEMASKLTSFSEIAIMNNVDDLVEVRSESSNGVGLVKLTFQPYVDMNTALSQVTGVSQTILRRMPQGTTPPLIIRTSPVERAHRSACDVVGHDVQRSAFRLRAAHVAGTTAKCPRHEDLATVRRRVPAGHDRP